MKNKSELETIKHLKKFTDFGQEWAEDIVVEYDSKPVWMLVSNIDGRATTHVFDTYEYAKEELRLSADFWLAQISDRTSYQEFTEGEYLSQVIEARTGELSFESGGFIHIYLQKAEVLQSKPNITADE